MRDTRWTRLANRFVCGHPASASPPRKSQPPTRALVPCSEVDEVGGSVRMDVDAIFKRIRSLSRSLLSSGKERPQ